MRLSEFLYDLPPELIAQTPLEDRAASRLLVLDRRTGAVRHLSFRDVPQLLEPGDLLMVNDTRVTALRLLGRRASGGRVEALLLQDEGEGRFNALLRPAKRLKEGEQVAFEGGLVAKVVKDLGEGKKALAFDGILYPDFAVFSTIEKAWPPSVGSPCRPTSTRRCAIPSATRPSTPRTRAAPPLPPPDFTLRTSS